MPGRNLFKKGLHPSRKGIHFAYRSDQGSSLYRTLCLALGARILRTDYQNLLFIMNHAERKETLRVAMHVTRKDSLAQLHAMIKIKEDSELIEALKNTDIKTFMMISKAQNELIAEKISETGYFIDSDGMQYTLYVPSLEEYTPPGVKYYLPDGIDGLRNAISLAAQHCKNVKEKRGRRRIESRRYLADEIWRIWKAYQPKASQEIWQRDDNCSLALSFARVVFEKVYGKTNLYSLAELMKECNRYKKRSK
jgi:hypothetical protein